MLELKLPTAAELRTAYREDLEACFPPAELKPLSRMEDMIQRGRYQPWCLYDDGGLIGECFLWLGRPGWALLDYLCVNPGWQNDGFGTWMLEELQRREDWTCILGEIEAPEDAPDPVMARRRMGFYVRTGARLAGYDTDLFGVHYNTMYWSADPIPDAVLLAEHQNIYQLETLPEKWRGYFRIPRTEDAHENPGL